MLASTSTVVANQVKAVFVPGLGDVTNTFAIVGSSTTNERTVIITGLQLSTATPVTVLLQPRQSENRDRGFHDVFAVQVVETAMDHLVVHIKRLDSSGGWAQDLRVDILIIEEMNN